MKRFTLMALVALFLVGLIGFAGQAYSTDAAPAKTAAACCEKFVDNNKDGVCDLAAQCKAGSPQCGKDCKNCPNFKDDNKDGRCDLAGTCAQNMSKSGGCPGHASGKCNRSGAGCGGCTKHR